MKTLTTVSLMGYFCLADPHIQRDMHEYTYTVFVRIVPIPIIIYIILQFFALANVNTQ